MTKITQFDKVNLKHIRNDVDAALKSVGEKYGINLRLANISFQSESFSGKLQATINGGGGEIVTPEMIELRKYGKLYLGDTFDETKTYALRGKNIKFVGLNGRSHKYPVIYQELATGKRYKMESDQAKAVVDPTFKPMF